MIDKERGLQLLGSGLGPSDVSQALGCDPSLVSQWLMDEDFRQNVLALRIQSLTAHTARDKKIDAIEDALIEKLQENIQYMVKTRDILGAFAILNNAKRRGASTVGAINITQQVVSINMPPVAKEYFFPKTNSQGEVVQVGDRVTVTKSLQQLMQERITKKLTAQDAEVIHESGSRSREGTGEKSAATAS